MPTEPITAIEVQALEGFMSQDQGFPHPNYPVISNWASILGHPCKRYLYHNRVDWERREPHDWKGIGERGNVIHDWWKIRMMEKGYSITQNETPLSAQLRTEYNIGGKIDGRIGKASVRPVLYEFKTMADYSFRKHNTLNDIRDSATHYIRMYLAQLMIYMHDNNEDFGLLVLCNATTWEWKWIVVPKDEVYVQWLLNRTSEINNTIALRANPPERTTDLRLCKRCDYRATCLPDIVNDSSEFVENNELLGLLQRKDELAPFREEWQECKERSEEIAKHLNRDFILNSSWKVELKRQIQRRVDTKMIPPDIRPQFEVEKEIVKVIAIPLIEAR